MNRWLERVKAATGSQPGNHRRRSGVYGAIVIAMFALLFLAGGSPLTDGPSTPLVSLGDILIRLGIVLAVAYASLLAVRSDMGARGAAGANQESIRVLQRCRLGPQGTLFLVAIEDRALLLGATPSQIATLAELGSAERFESVPSTAMPFAEHLRAFGLGHGTKAEGRNTDAC